MIQKIGGSIQFTGVFTYLKDIRQMFGITLHQAKLDLLERRLILYGDDGEDYSLYESLKSYDIDDLAIDNECISDYELIIKDRASKINYEVIYNLMINFGKQLEQNFNEISSMQNKVGILLNEQKLPSVMTLREIHDQLMPDKNLNYLRNLLAKNRSKEKNFWKSYLTLGRFSLRFEKPVGTKIWYIYRREFIEVRKER